MVYLIVGHRGVGKTEFLKNLKPFYDERGLPVTLYDLDEEISKSENKTINQIFADIGEEGFRALEAKMLQSLCEKHRETQQAVWISLGAGYQGSIPNYVKVIWLRRRSDVSGRVFIDRPKLEKEMAPLEEYRTRFLPRSARFRHWYHKQILLPEGVAEQDVVMPYLLGLKPAQMNASITVLPEIFVNEIRLEDFITEKLLLGVRFFELRDDLLSSHQIDRLLQEIPKDKILLSFRTKGSMNAPTRWWAQHKFDWSVELGACPFGREQIRSLHYRDPEESFTDACDRLMQHPADHYKLAVPIHTISELWLGHSWYMEDPEKRSFLPMSRDGRWNWYRSIINERMFLNFTCDSEGSSFDQPSLYEWLSAQVARPKHRYKTFEFAAILGMPIAHSHTPTEQAAFFRDQAMPVVKVPMAEEELHELSLSVLRRLGLHAAAITAPLKKKIAPLCRQLEGKAKQFNVVNTICWDDDKNHWVGTNTDIDALEEILAKMELPKQIVVWGGGGMRLTLMRLLPQAYYYSARRGDEVQNRNEKIHPELVIWAVDRSRYNQGCKWPQEDWKPMTVFDLNYSEDSPGREYALSIGANYISGQAFFQTQARMQRQFWLQQLVNENKDVRV